MKVSIMGYDFDIWPSGLKIDGQAQSFRTNRPSAFPSKEWTKALTRLHGGAIDKFIYQQANHMDILELKSMNA